jgi:hypothetical protein
MKSLMLSMLLLVVGVTGRASDAKLLVGHWELFDRQCSSGARPWDQFVPGRDSYSIEFRQDRFYTRAWIAGCQTFTEGRYEADGRTLKMSVLRGSTNCGNPQDLMGRFTYMYEKTTDQSFTVFIGPVRGGVCPHGDIVKTNYKLIP